MLMRWAICSARRPSQLTGSPARQVGFSLIEVVVAMAVLSLGLLGIAALQTNALRINQEDYYRIQAMTAAEQMAETVRVNWLDVDADDTPNEYQGLALSEEAHCRDTSGCTWDEMLEDSLWLVKESFERELPFIDVHVCQDSTLADSPPPEPNYTPPAMAVAIDDTQAKCDQTGNQVAIKIWWWDKRLTEWQLYSHALQIW